MIAIVIGLILALTLHEFAHAWMGNFLGDDTARHHGRLSLNPLSHIDPVMTLLLPLFLIIAGSPVVFGAAKPVPFNPLRLRGGRWGAAIVAFAGPATNLIIAIFLAVWLQFVNLPPDFAGILATIVRLNLALMIFNLIPFPPLDGSRILYAAAPYSVREVMDTIERSGFVAIGLFLLVLYPLLGRFMVSVVGALSGLLGLPQS